MKLTIDQVKKVAKLANLNISDDNLEVYGDQLSEILNYVDTLNKVSTDKEPLFNVSANTNITRSDEVGKSLPQTETLQNAKSEKQGYFVTKGVFEEN